MNFQKFEGTPGVPQNYLAARDSKLGLISTYLAMLGIDFHLFYFFFHLIQIFEEIASLSFQVSWTHQFLTEVKNFLNFKFFHWVFQILGEALCFLSIKDSLMRNVCYFLEKLRNIEKLKL